MSCDGVTEVEEEVDEINFYESLLDGEIFLRCKRSKESIHFKENDVHKNIFEIYSVREVFSIKK